MLIQRKTMTFELVEIVLSGKQIVFFCNFPMLDVEIKNSLFKVYCNSHYGSELWNLTNNKLEDYYIAWRKNLRRLWWLPYNSRQLSTALTSFTIQLFDKICHLVAELRQQLCLVLWQM
jgi:hypothetical protein